jgi:hypothetical protein
MINSAIIAQEDGTVKVKKSDCKCSVHLIMTKSRDTITFSEVNKSFGILPHCLRGCVTDMKLPIRSFDISINGSPARTFINPRVLPYGAFKVESEGTLVVSNILVRSNSNNADSIQSLEPRTFYIIDDTPPVSEPNYDPSKVKITLAGLSGGSASKQDIIQNPKLRLTNNPDESFALKSYSVAQKINGKSSQNNYTADTLLAPEEIQIIKSIKKNKEDLLFIQNVVVTDVKGREYKIPGIALKVLSE